MSNYEDTYEYQCNTCKDNYKRVYSKGAQIPPSIPCENCGGLANKISKFDKKIKTPELADDLTLLIRDLNKNFIKN